MLMQNLAIAKVAFAAIDAAIPDSTASRRAAGAEKTRAATDLLLP
jgi:hypothetical protein